MPKNEKTISEEKSIQTRIHTRIKKSKDVFNGSKDINAVWNCTANPKGNGKCNMLNAIKDQSYCTGIQWQSPYISNKNIWFSLVIYKEEEYQKK